MFDIHTVEIALFDRINSGIRTGSGISECHICFIDDGFRSGQARKVILCGNFNRYQIVYF